MIGKSKHEPLGKEKKKRRMPAAAPKPPSRVRKVVVDFPESLLRNTEIAASEEATNRSSFIRRAVEEYLRVRQRKAIQAELAAACEANSDLGRKICEEFAFVDSENL